jgi:Flp pilus assembly protein TadD
MRASLLLMMCVAGCATSAPPRPDPTNLHKQLARALLAHREWAAATEPLLELQARRPRDAEVQALLGVAYREQGLFEQADAAFTIAIRLDPRRAEAYAGRGILRDVRGEAGDAALDDFRQAIKLDPNQAGYYNNLGFALYVRGRYEEALQPLREGLRHDPSVRRMRNNLGFVYGRLGALNRAKREFEHVGDRATVENNLGLVHEQAGELAAACDCYHEAVRLDPLLNIASVNAARACATGGPGGAP